MDTPQPALGPILGAFAIAQVVAILIPVVLIFAGVDLGSGTNAAGSMAAAAIAAQMFVKRFGRAPSPEERHRLVWLSFGASVAISLGFVAILALLGGAAFVAVFSELWRKLPFVVLFAIVAVVSALYLAGFYVMYGWVARYAAKKLPSRVPTKRPSSAG